MTNPHRLGMYIKKIGNRMEAEANRQLREENLTYSQLSILMFLSRNERAKVSQKDIGDFLMTKHTSVIDVLKRLEEKGLLTRRTDSENSRCNNVALTAEGAALVKSVKESFASHEERLLAGFSEEEKLLLFGLLQRVLDNLGGQEPPTSERKE